MHSTSLRHKSLSLDQMFATAVVLAIGGGILSVILLPPKVEIQPAQTAWGNFPSLAAETASNAITPIQPEVQPSKPGFQLPFNAPIPQLSLPAWSMPQFPRAEQRPLRWQIQKEECPTHEYGNHWSGADEMNHCLVR